MLSPDRLPGFAATALVVIVIGGLGGLGIAAVGAGFPVSGRKD